MNTVELKKLRCSKGYFRQTDMAKALGMAAANYSNRERGAVKFSADEIMAICKLLDITLEEGLRIMA